nr:hypothetical protein BaRGS_027098 [Batillaria attramentaria]
MKFKGDYSEDDAECLLNKKLKGVVQSSQNALDKWSKQILHVWATSATAANAINAAYHNRVPATLKANTVVLVTTAAVSHFIFTNG